MFIQRSRLNKKIDVAFRVHPAVTLEGTRQCGKTTLAREISEKKDQSHHFDLEDQVDRRRLLNAQSALSELSGLVIIDEIQRQPQLFETIRVLVDRPMNDAQFLLLGSASPALVQGVSELLAGRVALISMSGFYLDEVGNDQWQTLWFRGGYPRSYLADDEDLSRLWQDNFIRLFLERDLPQLGVTTPADTYRRFWTMLAHYHGQIWNAAEFARAIGKSEATARSYLDILSGTFMVRVLQPWHENLRKRQVKSPKVYVRDSGLLLSLLEINSTEALSRHPIIGTSFEGFVVEQVLSILDPRNAYYWATYAGAELDLLITVAGKRFGFEVKYSDAPATTRSMRIALNDLRLEHLWIVYPGSESYELDDAISVLPVKGIPELIQNLG